MVGRCMRIDQSDLFLETGMPAGGSIGGTLIKCWHDNVSLNQLCTHPQLFHLISQRIVEIMCVGKLVCHLISDHMFEP